MRSAKPTCSPAASSAASPTTGTATAPGWRPRAPAGRAREQPPALGDHVFAPVDPDYVPADPTRAGQRQGHDGASHVVGEREPAARVTPLRLLEEELGAGNLARGRGVGHAGA